MTSIAEQVVLGTVEALGVPIRLVIERSGILTPSRVSAAWRDCLSVDPAQPAVRTIPISGEAIEDGARALSDLSTRVTLAALDALRGTHLLLHAGGVAAPDGRVLALVGPSGRGKTTAVRLLGRRFGYVSDESVAVDDHLAVQPYRKPLSLIVEGRPHKEQIAPSDLGLLPLPPCSLRLAAIALLDRDTSTVEAHAFPLDLVDAICELTPQISYLTELRTPLQYVARVVSRSARVTRLVYRDATDLPRLVDDVFAGPAPEPQPWSVLPSAAPAGPWRFPDLTDAILVEGRACILRDGVVTALDRRGCLVWTMCRTGAGETEITAAAVAAFGEPAAADARAVIEETLDELIAHGLLARA
ncbi:hypothetical protein [Microbacterium sp. B19]|uniref:hypothetical protein n=1 Tax=Microbacterium sp. B19 TaxID=96765 RepID=UPI0011D1889A|nr:hypothetical protein [Microbacterium sp. B19]